MIIPSLKKRRDDLCDKIRVLMNYFIFLRLSHTREISMSSVIVSLSNTRARFEAIFVIKPYLDRRGAFWSPPPSLKSGLTSKGV